MTIQESPKTVTEEDEPDDNKEILVKALKRFFMECTPEELVWIDWMTKQSKLKYRWQYIIRLIRRDLD